MAAVGYAVEGFNVYFTHHATGRCRLEGANAATFEALVDPVVVGTDRSEWRLAGHDGESVWYMNQRVPQADPSSFRYFHGGQCQWGADRGHIFAFYPGSKPRVVAVASRLGSTLRFLDESFDAYMRKYALTNERVYYFGRWVRGADPSSFRNLSKDRLGAVESSDLYRDDRHAYYFGRKLDGIDPDALILFHHPSPMSRVYAVDRESVYCVDATTRTKGRDVSGTPMTRLTHEEVRTEPRYQQVRDYLAHRVDLRDYWFNR